MVKKWGWLIALLALRGWLSWTFPIFNDESIYALWSRMIGTDFYRGLWPVLMDGKQPGLMVFWSMLAGWGSDPVWVLRLTSIGFGIATTLLLFKMYHVMTGKPMRWWQQLIVIGGPGLVWYQSLGLQESAVMWVGTAMTAWSLERALKQDWGVKQGLVLGSIAALGVLIKPTALLTAGSVAGAAVLSCQKRPQRLKQAAITLALALGIGCLASQMVRFHQGYLAYMQRSAERSEGLQLILKQPGLLVNRILDEGQWLLWWVGPLAVAGGWALVKPADKRRETDIILGLGWAGVVAASLAAGPGIFASRYIAPAFPLLTLAGLTELAEKRQRWKELTVSGWAGINLVIISAPLLSLKIMAALPAVAADFSQYVSGWPSGWGVKEAINTVTISTGEKKSLVLVRADAGNPESAVLAYLWDNPTVQAANTVNAKSIIEKKLAGELDAVPIYYISRGTQMGGLPADHLKQLAIFPKPLDSEFVGVFELVK